MSLDSNTLCFAAFVCGAALLSAAALCIKFNRDVELRRSGWLLALAAGAQGLGQGSDSLAIYLGQESGPAPVRLVLAGIALAALVEFGRIRGKTRKIGGPGWLPGRWVYPLWILVAALLAAFGGWRWAEVFGQCALALQAAALGLAWIRQPAFSKHPQIIELFVALAGLAVYLLAACIHIPALGVMGSLAALGGFWLACRNQLAPDARGGWLRQGRAPAGFLLVLALGWFCLGRANTPPVDLNGESLVAMQQMERYESDNEPAPSGRWLMQLCKCALAGVPILIIVALSRLPSAR